MVGAACISTTPSGSCGKQRRSASTSDISTRCRRVTAAWLSTWLLAAFGALGYLVRSADEFTPPDGTLLFAIGAVAATGIAVLWLPDVHVYHSLLEAWFTKGLELEDDYRQLLGTRRLIVDSRGFLPGDLRIPVPVSITAFYCLVALVVLLSAFFLSPARDGRGELLCTCRWAASGVIFLVVSSIAFYRAYTMQPLRKPARE